MADVEKFTDDGVDMLLKHSERQIKNDANKDIVKNKQDLNYSVPINTNGMSPKEYYKELVSSSFIYGRGSQREKETVTCCSWVITLPKSVSDYSSIGKDEIVKINPEAEEKFFSGVTQFVSNRYGTVFYNRVHYDEGGQPHVHIYFVPRTKLDHTVAQNKTRKTHEEIKTETGRYEYKVDLVKDNGNLIPLKNYSKMTDYFDYKISGKDVLNKAELSHFHKDLAEYAKENKLPGADAIYTGKTDGQNVSLKTMKEFTKSTGLTIEDLKTNPLQKDELKELLSKADKIKPSEKRIIETINSDALIINLQSQVHNQETKIEDLWSILSGKEKEIEALQDIKSKPIEEPLPYKESLSRKDAEIRELKDVIFEKDRTISDLDAKLTQANERIKNLENSLTQTYQQSQEWGSSQGWGEGTNTWGTDHDVEGKIW